MSSEIHTKEYKYLIKKLVEARKEKGLTQKDVAEILNKNQSFISKIETRERKLTIMELKHLADLYGKELRFFFK